MHSSLLCPSSFHASRYPAIPKDTAHKFDPATHNHVVFIRNNRFFEVQLAYPDGTELSAADLEAYESTLIFFFWIKTENSCRHTSSIADVIRRADTHKGVPFGALTSENRDTWTRVRISSAVVSFSNDTERAIGAPTTDPGLASQ